MKITVVADSKGEVIGSIHHRGGGTGARAKKAPTIGLTAGPGQTVHEIDLPSHLETVESGEQLHKELTALLKKHRKG
jgi:hypothetical protein